MITRNQSNREKKTELAAFKTRISLACKTISALQTKVQTLDQAFEFPSTATECTIFIAEKMAEIDEVKLSLSVLLENLKSQIDVVVTNTMARKEQSERERLVNDLDAFLNTEAHETEIIAIQWTGRLKYRLGKLEKQSSLIQARPTTPGVTSARDADRDSTLSPIRHIENKMRLPQLEVPEEGRPSSTDEILDILENATAMKETIALTTDAFNDSFTLDHAKHDHTGEGHSSHARFEQPLRNADQRTKTRSRCVCGSSAHTVMQCPTFRTPEARRNEAGRRGSCWKCFYGNHKSIN
ncbi:hypothetical protein ANCDUO_07066 [Ancylostoma duodenale]|uniref:Uncharacterized protein n=1 Tax=Ancylostoma duodenale TaxID=51022 RepID=A0A0C2GZU9_9BILA|nr:hypothetical protein ANCDUO_07066 [Ancylostoma duodenale]